jgi:hypothetical protein
VILSANPTVNRREELLLRERLATMNMKLDTLVMEVGALAPAFPQASDIEEVGRMLWRAASSSPPAPGSP